MLRLATRSEFYISSRKALVEKYFLSDQTRWGFRESWWQDYYLYSDDICLTSDNCDVSRDTGDTRDMWPDISWHGRDITGLWLSQKYPALLFQFNPRDEDRAG